VYNDAFRARLPTPALRRLYDYWNLLREGRPMPARRDVDPVEIPDLLPNIVLLDVVGGQPRRFRLRLMGTAITDRLGENTGRYLDDIGLGTAYGEIAANYGKCVRTREPAFSESDYLTEARKYVRVWRLALPLSDNGQDVNIVLVGLFFRESLDAE
ncbi:MAG: PAS domain-containing protein, partial [Geminicoccales bacterium]